MSFPQTVMKWISLLDMALKILIITVKMGIWLSARLTLREVLHSIVYGFGDQI